MNKFIHQIFYSEETRGENDPGFIQLNNLENLRPDWREYWPVRNYLMSNQLDDDGYYGFFSPKFRRKTGLLSSQVYEFIDASASDVDIFLFSPFFDQSAFAINVFEQAAYQHRDILKVLDGSMRLIDSRIDVSRVLMDSSTTVFCNYFVAKPKFWRHWLDKCEKIFSVAEDGASQLGVQLNSSTNHDGSSAPAKVFVIERVASALLLDGTYKVKSYNPMRMPYAESLVSRFKSELCMMDALKIAYAKNAYPEYINEYIRIRSEIMQAISKIN